MSLVKNIAGRRTSELPGRSDPARTPLRGSPLRMAAGVLAAGCLGAFWLVAPTARGEAASAAKRVGAETLVKQVGLDQHLDAQIPLDLPFCDETGQSVQLGEYLRDKPVILTLVYFRCPMLCNQVLNGLLQASQAIKFTMGEDYEVITVSIDPRETPEMAAARKERYVAGYRRVGAERGWHFLTGPQSSIDAIARTVGFRYVYDPGSDQFAHASGIVLLTPQGRISRYFYGIDYYPNDLRLGLVESSQGRIGNRVDQLLLLCYHYDPATGRYGVVISNAIRVAGTATVLVLGSFLWLMYRQERRRSAASAAGVSVPLPAEAPD